MSSVASGFYRTESVIAGALPQAVVFDPFRVFFTGRKIQIVLVDICYHSSYNV